MFSQLMRWWKGKRPMGSLKTNSPAKRARLHPKLEQLEDRMVPSVVGGGNQAQLQVRVLAIGANQGDQAANQVFASGDLPGSVYRGMSIQQFNAIPPTALRNLYDVILVTWNSSPALSLDWSTRVLPFLQQGGEVISEDPNTLPQLAAVVTGQTLNAGGPYSVSQVPVLTAGVNNNFVNRHMVLNSWDSGMTAFMNSNASTIGVYGQYGEGRIVITGTDQDYNGLRNSSDAATANQYNFLVDEFRWELTPRVMTPGTQLATAGTPAAISLGSFYDPIATDGPWTVNVSWGDSSNSVRFQQALMGDMGSLQHAFPAVGTYTVTVSVTGALGLLGAGTINVNVGPSSGGSGGQGANGSGGHGMPPGSAALVLFQSSNSTGGHRMAVSVNPSATSPTNVAPPSGAGTASSAPVAASSILLALGGASSTPAVDAFTLLVLSSDSGLVQS